MSSEQSGKLLTDALIKRPKAVRKAVDKMLCERTLVDFVKVFWPEIEPANELVFGWPLEAVCEHLEAVTFGEIKRLLLNVPPGFMKSLLSNVFWPAWEWGPMGMASIRTISASYSQNLTIRDNIKFRNIITSDLYREFWGETVAPDPSQFTTIKVGNTKTGWKIASSVTGTITGERGDRFVCLPSDSRILTDRGWLEIGRIVNEQIAVRVAGWSGDSIEWQEIESFQVNPTRPILEIDFGDGKFRCTFDHRVYVDGRGWVRAQEIRAGDAILSCGDQAMRALRERLPYQEEPRSSAPVLQQELQVCGENRASLAGEQSSLPSVWQDGLSATVALTEGGRQSVLQSPVPWNSCGRPEQPDVPGRPNDECLSELSKGFSCQAVNGAARGMLLDHLSERVDEEADGREKPCFVSNLRQAFCQEKLSADPVLEGVQRPRPCQDDGRHGERALCARRGDESLSAGLDAELSKENQSPRRECLCDVRDVAGAARQAAVRPSYRLRQGQSGSDKPDDTLPILPREAARQPAAEGRLARKIVCGIKNLGILGPNTFNVSVAPHHNYFVDGALCKNCDDPNAVNEVESDSIRDSTNTWFRETVPTRLNKQDESAIIVIQQRVHEVDVTGTILDLGLPYDHVCIPMRYDSTRHCVTSIGWEDPRGLDEDGNRLEGAALDAADGTLAWPERFPERSVKALEITLGPYAASGQLQQQPSPRGGGIFKIDWWKQWPPEEWPQDAQERAKKEFPYFSYVVASLDTALTLDQENDFTALTIWGIWKTPDNVASVRKLSFDQGGFSRITEIESPKIMLLWGWQKRLGLHGPPEYKPDYMTMDQWNSPWSIAKRKENWGIAETVAHDCRLFKVDHLLIENKAGGQHVIRELQGMLNRWDFGITLVDPGRQDKVARAHSVVHLFSSDLVYAPRGKQWCDDIVYQAARFPRGKNDDLVDSMTQALQHLRDTRWAIRKDESEDQHEQELSAPIRSRPLYDT